MTEETLLILAAVAAIGCAVVLGPMALTIRAVLRLFMPRPALRRWQKPIVWGLRGGLVGATAAAGFWINGGAALLAATLGILFLLAILDLAWRWLPFQWTLPILVLGGISAVANDQVTDAILGLLIGGGTLMALQFTFRILRGVEALGTGDIWLAAGLGLLAGMPNISWILCLSAVSALAFSAVSRLASKPAQRHRLGVAYGTHLILAYLVFLIF
jgi:leader peptidase (prepilin peptidase)/N-methyltransferase